MVRTMIPHTLPWMEPLDLARRYLAEPLVLLYSGVQAGYSGNVSLLACGLAEEVPGTSFDALAPHLSTSKGAYENAWFGWFGYGLKDGLEKLPPDAPGYLALPALWMARFENIFRFDHTKRELTCWAKKTPALPPAREKTAADIQVGGIESNMSREVYLAHVARIVEAIRAGDLYQANLTRKFHGMFKTEPDSFALFEKLVQVSPAPYSAYIRTPGCTVLSSSPERFLKMDAGGKVTTRPIKGSAPRGKDAAEDAQLREALHASSKDRAENLMIVDLMRNDLARACVPGSVRAENLFEVTAHANVHHLSSTVSGQRAANASPLSLVAACFPPGSMTGAPKIRAVSLCTEIERMERGIYSGALGWLGGDGSLDLSVVIRTLVMQAKQFEFQVGGGIVADSTPEGEWRETLVKATGLARALGISPKTLEAL